MTESNPLQRTAEWYADRAGCLTASAIAPLYDMGKVGAGKGKPKKAYYDLIDRLIAERLTGTCEPSFVTSSMQWGIDNEEAARERYEAQAFEPVDLVGFIKHPEIEWLGASPDGLVGDDGLLEIKCPNTTTHLRRIREGVVPEEYKAQMMLQLLVTGRKWCDFVDFDPRLTGKYEHLQFFCVRFEPSAAELEDCRRRCEAFLAEVDKALEDLLF